ncbi:MAG: septal ring lytic transglycosylase RlpA family protein, partial [Gammaproteobacteria bacterium]
MSSHPERPDNMIQRALAALTMLTLGACTNVNMQGTLDQVTSAFTSDQQDELYDSVYRDTPDAAPRPEPLSRRGNPPSYQQNGQTYTVLNSAVGFLETGGAQVYPTNFHGKRTANGEVYDMFAMSAGHKSLPLPSYVRVTHKRSGRSVVVRV